MPLSVIPKGVFNATSGWLKSIGELVIFIAFKSNNNNNADTDNDINDDNDNHEKAQSTVPDKMDNNRTRMYKIMLKICLPLVSSQKV